MKMLNGGQVASGILYARLLIENYEEENRETHFLRGMIAAYETVLEY